MRKTGIFSKDHGNIQLVNTNSPPTDNPDMRRGPSNRQWNEHVLLLLQRAKLLRITDIRAEELERVEGDTEDNASWLPIQLLEPSITAYPEGELFHTRFMEVRDKELEEIRSNLTKMERLVRDYDQGEAKQCIAHAFAALYSDCARACGGCLYCRQQGVAPYERVLPLEIDDQLPPRSASFLHGELHSLMGWQATIHLTWDGPEYATALTQLHKTLASLMEGGMQQLLLPTELLHDQQWMQQLVLGLAAQHVTIPHLIHALDDVKEPQHIPLYSIPTIVVYPTDDAYADAFHRVFRRQLQRWLHGRIPLIFVVPPALYLESENGFFADRIEGGIYTIKDLYTQLERWRELEL
jgi:hypothetical protein